MSIACVSVWVGMRRNCTIFAIAMILLGLSACGEGETVLRYRLSVEVDTPLGVRKGDSVVEVRAHVSPAFPGPEAYGLRLNFSGEATPVEVVDGKYIFAVFKWVDPPNRTYEMLTNGFARELPPTDPDYKKIDESMLARLHALKQLRGIKEVSPEDYPAIATFSDLSDPYSAKAYPAPQLWQLLPGYHIRRMTIEITDAPVSRRIVQILPWLQHGDFGFLDREVRANPLTNFPEYRKIDASSFTRSAR